MLRTGMIAGVLAVAGVGAAEAQAPAACAQIKTLMSSTHPQVKALQGAQTKTTDEDIIYTSKTQLAGFTGCTLESAKVQDKYTKYFEHHLGCDGEAATPEAATVVVEQLYACLKEGFSERSDKEAWMGGKYRVVGFQGEHPQTGRGAALVDFGKTPFARIVVDKSYEGSDEYDVHIYWYFTQ